jgi:hypothetical protein
LAPPKKPRSAATAETPLKFRRQMNLHQKKEVDTHSS